MVIAALYFISAITMLLIDRSGRIKRERGNGAWSDMLEGLTYVRTHPPVLGLIVLSIIPFLFGMPLNTLLPAFNQDVMGGHADDLGFLVSAMGAGAIVGSLMMASMGSLKRKGFWLVVACLVWGGLTALFGTTEQLLFAVPLITMIGWVSSWNMSLNRGMLQMQVDDHMRGRVMSIDMMSHGLMPLGVFPVSWIAERYGVGMGLVFSGSMFVFVTLLCLLLVPAVRRVDVRTAAGADRANGAENGATSEKSAADNSVA